MAGRVQEVCALIVDDYGGDAAAIWTTAADGKQLLANVKALPGFGEQKARIFVALLGKQLGVRPAGWEQAASPFGEAGTFRSVADIDSPEALAKVRQYKQRMKAKAKAKRVQAGVNAAAAPGRPAGTSAGRRLYLCSPDRPDLELFIDACIEGGVDIVQLRDKRLTDAQLVARAGRVQRVCADHRCPSSSTIAPTWLRPSVPTASMSARRTWLPTRPGGWWAPRPSSGCPPTDRRSRAGHRARRCADRRPVDYISAGPVTPTPTKPGRPGTGLGYVREATSGRRGRCGSPGASIPTTVAGHGRSRRPTLRRGPVADRGGRPRGRARCSAGHRRRAIDERRRPTPVTTRHRTPGRRRRSVAGYGRAGSDGLDDLGPAAGNATGGDVPTWEMTSWTECGLHVSVNSEMYWPDTV